MKFLQPILLLFLNISISFSQKLIKESIIQENERDANFYSIKGNDVPSVIDGGGEIFVIESGNKLIGCDMDLNKKWETPVLDLLQYSKSILIGNNYAYRTYYRAINQSTFYDIVFQEDKGRPLEIAVVSYNLRDGKSTVNVIPMTETKGTEISGVFTHSDGLYFMKIHRNSKTGPLGQYLCKVTSDGKISEVKLDLPFKPQELKDLDDCDFNKFGRYLTFVKVGATKDQFVLMQGYVVKNKETKSYEARITLGYMDKTGKFTLIDNAVLNQPEDALCLTVPRAIVDTINNRIYIDGFLIKKIFYNGIYHYTYDLTAKKSFSSMVTFDALNETLLPKEKIKVVPFPGATNDYDLINKLIYNENDFYNKLDIIYIENKFDVLSAPLIRYMYVTGEGKVVEIVKLVLKKGKDIDKVVLYSDKSRKIKNGKDYLEEHFPIDPKYISSFTINRKDFVILVQAMETKARIVLKKVAIE